MKEGDWVQTPRFGRVKIEEVFENRFEAIMAGYCETTHYWNDPEYDIYGKSLDMYHMEFAAIKKKK